MPRVKFYYDFKKDAWSWVVIVKARKRIEQLKGNWKERVAFIPKKDLRNLAIQTHLRAREKIWRKIEKKFFEKLEKVIKKPIFIPEFKCYLTTGITCPYDPKENSFMVSLWQSVSFNLTVICHAILHLQFLHSSGKYCRKFLSQNQFDDLKEALTFLLNTKFNDLLLCQDPGYPRHQKLREKLKEVWEKEKDFDKFLDKAIRIVSEFC